MWICKQKAPVQNQRSFSTFCLWAHLFSQASNFILSGLGIQLLTFSFCCCDLPTEPQSSYVCPLHVPRRWRSEHENKNKNPKEITYWFARQCLSIQNKIFFICFLFDISLLKRERWKVIGKGAYKSLYRRITFLIPILCCYSIFLILHTCKYLLKA